MVLEIVRIAGVVAVAIGSSPEIVVLVPGVGLGVTGRKSGSERESG
jgi:hypothetical protein